ncbi:MAG: inhibitor of the pro-sigma processing machinery [Eubacteriales bacterium]|nr:inhibitor of the pro-sigma processing machinery [Eubacteriales bacterium]
MLAEDMIVFSLALLVTAIFVHIFATPLRILLKLFLRGVAGGVVLFLLNAVGSPIGLNLPLNVVSALVVGYLGVPGLCLLVTLHYLFLIG